MTDDDLITALFERLCASWTAGDARAYGQCFTEDCDYVSFDGYRARGRADVVSSHAKLFAGVLYGSALVGEVESIRHLDADVALVHSTGSVLVAWRSTLPRRRLTRNTITAVRTPDGWRSPLSTTAGSGRSASRSRTRYRPGWPAGWSAPRARSVSAGSADRAARRIATTRGPG